MHLEKFMACPLHSLPRLGTVAALSCLVHLHAVAQSHVQGSGDHVLRASTVAAGTLPAKMREQHGIPSDPNTGVLNVTVQRQAGGQVLNVRASLDVQARNLLGAPTSVQMREVVANGMVSYLGAYHFLPREVLDFRITARPEGDSPPIVLEFRDRLTADRTPSAPS